MEHYETTIQKENLEDSLQKALYALGKSDTSFCQYLQNISPSMLDQETFLDLFCAGTYGSRDCFEKLLDYFQPLKLKEWRGKISVPYLEVSEEGSTPEKEMLVTGDLLLIACLNGTAENIELLAECGFDVKSVQKESELSIPGYPVLRAVSPLTVAVAAGNNEIVNWYAEKGLVETSYDLRCAVLLGIRLPDTQWNLERNWAARTVADVLWTPALVRKNEEAEQQDSRENKGETAFLGQEDWMILSGFEEYDDVSCCLIKEQIFCASPEKIKGFLEKKTWTEKEAAQALKEIERQCEASPYYAYSCQPYFDAYKEIVLEIVKRYPNLLDAAVYPLMLFNFTNTEEALLQTVAANGENVKICGEENVKKFFDYLSRSAVSSMNHAAVRILGKSCGISMTASEFMPRIAAMQCGVDEDVIFRDMVRQCLENISIQYEDTDLKECTALAKILISFADPDLFRLALAKEYLQKEPRDKLMELVKNSAKGEMLSDLLLNPDAEGYNRQR
jgi:hypothetical protein